MVGGDLRPIAWSVDANEAACGDRQGPGPPARSGGPCRLTMRGAIRLGRRRPIRDVVGASAPVLVGLAFMPLVIAAGFWAERTNAPSPVVALNLRPSFDPAVSERP